MAMPQVKNVKKEGMVEWKVREMEIVEAIIALIVTVVKFRGGES